MIPCEYLHFNVPILKYLDIQDERIRGDRVDVNRKLINRYNQKGNAKLSLKSKIVAGNSIQRRMRHFINLYESITSESNRFLDG